MERRGFLMGLWSGFMPLGNAMIILGAPIILISNSWQMIWVVGIALNIVAIILGFKIIPKDRVKSDGKIDLSAIRDAISRQSILVLGILFAMHSIVYQALLQFMPSFGKGIFGLPLFWASIVTVVFCLLSFSGNLVAGQMIQRGWTAAKIVLFAGTSLSILIITMTLSENNPFLFATALTGVGLITGMTPTVCFYLLSREKTDDPRNMPVFTAWLFQIQGCGMFLGPFIFAIVVEAQNSWIAGIGVLAGICFIKVGLSFFLKEK